MTTDDVGGDPPCWAHLLDDDGTIAKPPRSRDLDDREEIAEFVTRFYRQIAQDERFHLYFDTIAHVDWHAHTLDLTDFWAGVLLGEAHQSPDDLIESHRWLHREVPFDAELFERWLEIFDSTLRERWSGPMADQASRRAHGYAWAMAKRIADVNLRS